MPPVPLGLVELHQAADQQGPATRYRFGPCNGGRAAVRHALAAHQPIASIKISSQIYHFVLSGICLTSEKQQAYHMELSAPILLCCNVALLECARPRRWYGSGTSETVIGVATMMTCTYCGRRLAGSEPRHQLFRNGKEWIPPSNDEQEQWWSLPWVWGESTEGARKLAWGLLFDAMRSRKAADATYIDFAQEIVRNLPASWWLLGTDIRDWYANYKPAGLFPERG